MSSFNIKQLKKVQWNIQIKISIKIRKQIADKGTEFLSQNQIV